jgi:hypothetical protein
LHTENKPKQCRWVYEGSGLGPKTKSVGGGLQRVLVPLGNWSTACGEPRDCALLDKARFPSSSLAWSWASPLIRRALKSEPTTLAPTSHAYGSNWGRFVTPLISGGPPPRTGRPLSHSCSATVLISICRLISRVIANVGQAVAPCPKQFPIARR